MDLKKQQIFISYCREDIAIATALDNVFRREGWSVWRDEPRIRAGDNLEKRIHEGLRSSDCVVLLWSENSADSEWVEMERTIGRFASFVIPVRLDNETLPEGARDRLAVSLAGWDGVSSNDSLTSLLDRISGLVAPKNLEQAESTLKEKALRGLGELAGLASDEKSTFSSRGRRLAFSLV